MLSLVQKIIGSRNERFIKKISKTVQKVNSLESNFEKLSDDQLKEKTSEYRERLANGQSLESLIPEAFATVREASRRVKDMRHYDVQLIGGIVLHMGKVAEMRTGEGKTLVATLPAYLNAYNQPSPSSCDGLRSASRLMTCSPMRCFSISAV